MEYSADLESAYRAATAAVLAYAQAIEDERVPGHRPALFFVAEQPHNREMLHLTIMGDDAGMADVMAGAVHLHPGLGRVMLKASMKSPAGPSQN